MPLARQEAIDCLLGIGEGARVALSCAEIEEAIVASARYLASSHPRHPFNHTKVAREAVRLAEVRAQYMEWFSVTTAHVEAAHVFRESGKVAA